MNQESDAHAEGAPGEPVAALLQWEDAQATTHEQALMQPLMIGRQSDNGVSLPGDSSVSRHHALVSPGTGSEWTLSDLGSANGTTLNGRLVAPRTPVALHDGDRFTIGQTTFTFQQVVVDPEPTFATVDVSSTALNLQRPIIGWLELPDGAQRLLDLETRIGRSARSDIVLTDDTQVSRNHASIRHRNGAYLLSDLGSANGVCVNGEPVLAPRELHDGDRITIGTTTLRFILTVLSESPGETGFVSPDEFAPLSGSTTSLFELFGQHEGTPGGELREVTTLFADMRGSTALSERLNNPEQTTLIVNRIFDALTNEIVRYEGWVVKYAGDNIMAIFGAPRAHEDDPERCVKAALAMLRALDRINAQLRRQLGLSIQMRFGIACGQVLYGEVGGGAFRRLDVMGPSVNLASRLEHASGVGQITVSEEVQARARHAFLFAPLPPLELKGIREEVRAYEVRRERRPSDVDPDPPGPEFLIGREAELALLSRTLDEVRGGEGRLLAIVGEAGLGTAHLLAAFRRIAFPPASGAGTEPERSWIAARAASYEGASPYAFLVRVLRTLLGLDEQEAIERAALRNALAAALPAIDEATRAEYSSLVGALLGVRAVALAPDGGEPRIQRKLLVDVVRGLVRARGRLTSLGRAQPLIVVLEELQWADSASVEIFSELVDTVASAPLLLLLTYRPGWAHPWSTRAFYRQITLAELTAAQSRDLLHALLPGAILSGALATHIITQCGNNPLLLEETVKGLRQRGVLAVQDGNWTLTADLSAMSLPASLVSLLMVRLDQCSAGERAILRRAAVIGPSFTYRLLAALPGTPTTLEDHLDRLCEAELIVGDPQAAEPEYHFARAIMQEFVYNTILAQERRELHGQIAHALELAIPTPTDEQIEVLAYHYDRSAERAQAIRYLLRSGQRARRLSANQTALERFTAAEAKLRGLSSRDLAREGTLAAQIHEALGDTYLAEADFARAQERYELALTLVPLAPEKQAHLWRQIGQIWEFRGEGRKALTAYAQAHMGGSLSPLARAELQIASARAHVLLGDDANAQAAIEGGLAVAETLDGNDRERTEAGAQYILGLIAANGGQTDEAVAALSRALMLYRELGDTAGIHESYHQVASLFWSRGQFARAFEQLLGVTTLLGVQLGEDEPAIPPNRDDRLPPFAADVSGEIAQLERYYHDSLIAARRSGDRWNTVQIAHRAGQLLYRQGETARAAAYLRQAAREADAIGARGIVAAASIISGSIAVAEEDTSGVAALERGVLIAEALGLDQVLTEGRLRLAEARQQFGDPAAARYEGQSAFWLAMHLGQQPLLGLTHRLLGRLAGGRGEWDLAERHLRQALDSHIAIDAQDGVGRTLLDFAALRQAQARSAGTPRPVEAVTMLQQALAIFTRLGMRADQQATQLLLEG